MILSFNSIISSILFFEHLYFISYILSFASYYYHFSASSDTKIASRIVTRRTEEARDEATLHALQQAHLHPQADTLFLLSSFRSSFLSTKHARLSRLCLSLAYSLLHSHKHTCPLLLHTAAQWHLLLLLHVHSPLLWHLHCH